MTVHVGHIHSTYTLEHVDAKELLFLFFKFSFLNKTYSIYTCIILGVDYMQNLAVTIVDWSRKKPNFLCSIFRNI